VAGSTSRNNRAGCRPRIAIETTARQYGLGFIPAQDEHYDFIVPKTRLGRAAVQRFRAVLEDPVTRDALIELGFNI
jgi:putative molybdopterin biosynthesis protein